MLTIDPNELSERDNYKFLIGSIIPRPIAFITSLAGDGTINAAPFSFFNIVSSNPPLISVSIQRRNGMRKDTAENIVQNLDFVVHIVDQSNVDEINKTAATLPSDESELNLTSFSVIPSSKIRTPGVKEARVRMECVLEQVVELGEENEIGCDLIIGRVVQYHIDQSLYQEGRIDGEALAAVSRLAGNHYAKIGDIFTIERPE